MNHHDLTRALVRVATIAPHLTGGATQLQRERADTLLDSLGDKPTVEDLEHALRQLVRTGVGGNQLTWSAIVRATLDVTRRRLDDETQTLLDDLDPDTLIPMPADFREQVNYWRDKARAQALTLTCPTCQAPPDQPCDTNTSSTTINEAGHHYPRQNYGVQHTRPADHLTRRT